MMHSYKIRVLHLFLAVFFFFSFLNAEPVVWPDISTDEAKVQFLLYAEKLYPNLFEGMTAHDTDLLMTLSLQEKVLQSLRKDPKFAKLFSEIRERKQVNVGLVADVPAAKVTVDTKAFEMLRKEVEEAVTQLPQTGDVKANLREAIVKALTIRPGETQDKTALKLFDNIPEADRKPLFKLSLEQKADYFKKLVASDPAAHKKTADKLAALEQLRQRDEALRKYTALATIIASRDVKTSADVAKILPQLKPEEEAPIFSGNEEILSSVKTILSSADYEGATPFSEQKLMQSTGMVKDAMSPHTKAFKTAAAPKPPEPKQAITLTEAAAPYAIFRGCVGGDCASKNLAAYAQSPAHRIFYIDIGKGHPAAYVESQEVMSNGKKYLYISTVNGMGLNGDHAEMAIRGLEAAKKDLGVEGILLPQPEQLGLNINYTILRDRVAQMVEGAKEVDIKFIDEDFRRALKENYHINSDNYHSPDKIKKAVVYTPTAMNGDKILIDVKANPGPDYKPEPIQQGRALMLALELAHMTIKPQYSEVQLKNLGKLQEHIDYDFGTRVQLIDRILKSAKISEAEFNRIKKLLLNEEGLPFQEAVDRVAKELAKYGYTLDTKFKKSSITPFLPALLRSSDAFDKEWKDKTIAGTVTLLEQGVESDLVARTIKKHPDYFKGLSRLKNLLVKNFKFENTLQYYPAWEIAETLGKASFKIDEMPEVLEKLKSEMQGDYYHQKAAAGALVKMKVHPDEALGQLLKMAESQGYPMDVEFLDLMNEAKTAYPEATKKALEGASDGNIVRMQTEMQSRACTVNLKDVAL